MPHQTRAVRRPDTPCPNRVSPKIRQMQWQGGKDAGQRVQMYGQVRSPPEEICNSFGDILQVIAILNASRKIHSAEEVESIQ